MEHALLVALLILKTEVFYCISHVLLRFEARGAVHGADVAASGIVGGVGRVVLILLKGMNARFYAPHEVERDKACGRLRDVSQGFVHLFCACGILVEERGSGARRVRQLRLV